MGTLPSLSGFSRPWLAGLLLFGYWWAGGMPAAGGQPDNSFVIPAYAYDRGNARLFTTTYADAEPMIASSGKNPVFAEYDIELPIAGDYAISSPWTVVGCPTAAAERPAVGTPARPSGKRLPACGFRKASTL